METDSKLGIGDNRMHCIKRGKHRKKVLVVVTDGEDNSSKLDFRELVDRAEEEDVLIYPVGMFESWGMGSGDPFKIGAGDNYTQLQLERLAQTT